MAGDKGKFTTEIPDDVLNAAVDAVKRREVKTDPATPEASEAATIEVAPLESAGEQTQKADKPGEPEEASEVEQLKMQLEMSMAKGRELMGKIKEEHERALRAVADLENYKKRTAKEREEAIKFGNEKLLKDFLPVLDNFDRALEHTSKGGDLKSLEQGVQMVRKLFEDTLGKHGVKGIDSKGKPFDPNFHEAMQQIETSDLPPNHVAMEVVRGFTLNDRLIRPALVAVSKAPAKSPEAPPPAKPDGEQQS